MPSADLEVMRAYYRQRQVQRRAQRESERLLWLQRVREAVLRLAPRYLGIRGVYLFGSLLQPGRFRADSDIDIAIECDSLETESAFWHALEQELKRDVDVRPLTGAIAEVVSSQGERVYG